MKKIVIEKDAVPNKQSRREFLEKMEVGDSFLVEREEMLKFRQIASAHFNGKTDRVYRATVKNQPDGMGRVWREK